MADTPAFVFLVFLLWEVTQVFFVSTSLSTALALRVIWSSLCDTSFLNKGSRANGSGASSSGERAEDSHGGAHESSPAQDEGYDGNSGRQLPMEIESFALYEGIVRHHRSLPVKHSFEYHVRFAVVNMDSPPAWFARSSAKCHLSADEARALAGTTGPVYLLTNPTSVGYEQNPISVFYCYDRASSKDRQSGAGPLLQCISEVTNTPWGERVLFPFSPTGDAVPKPLHVSPFMDMESTWRIHAPPPGESLSLVFTLGHPRNGRYFDATLQATRVCRDVKVPEAFLWLMPHKIAFWIYWQALLLWWKGVPLLSHPKYERGNEYKTTTLDRDSKERTRPKRSLSAACPAVMAAGSVPGFAGFTRGMSHFGASPEDAHGGEEEGVGEAVKLMRCPYLWRDATSWPWNI